MLCKTLSKLISPSFERLLGNFVVFNILQGIGQAVDTIFKAAKSSVATIADEITNVASMVIVVSDYLGCDSYY